VSPVKYELGFYILEDGIPHSHRCENLKYYTALTSWALQWRRNVSPVRYELGFYIPGYGILFYSGCKATDIQHATIRYNNNGSPKIPRCSTVL
jgi:hypothetical protein